MMTAADWRCSVTCWNVNNPDSRHSQHCVSDTGEHNNHLSEEMRGIVRHTGDTAVNTSDAICSNFPHLAPHPSPGYYAQNYIARKLFSTLQEWISWKDWLPSRSNWRCFLRGWW